MATFTLCTSGCTSVTSSSTDSTPSDNDPGTVTTYTLDSSCACCGDCTCPDDLATSYTVNFDWYESDGTTFIEHITVTCSGPNTGPPGACYFEGSNGDVGTVRIIYGSLSGSGTTPPCGWFVSIGEGERNTSDLTEDPIGTYDDSCGVLGCWKNVVVS
jgi:hypothetical protein